jgi:hypothetical protein
MLHYRLTGPCQLESWSHGRGIDGSRLVQRTVKFEGKSSGKRQMRLGLAEEAATYLDVKAKSLFPTETLKYEMVWNVRIYPDCFLGSNP